MSKIETMKPAGAVKGLAVAAALALMSIGSQAQAAENIILHSASMDTTYWANVGGVTAYSSGVTFSVSNVSTPSLNYDIFGFCVDIYHDMYLGTLNGGAGYLYTSNKDEPGEPLTHDFFSATTNTLDADQKAGISDLVDIGFLLHRDNLSDPDTSVKLAAIQAAIWNIEVPGSVSLYYGNIGGPSSAQALAYSAAYQGYLDAYTHPTSAAGDRIYVIADNAHQSFAIGWPRDAVPEPATWAMMLLGFFGVGSALRSRKAATATA